MSAHTADFRFITQDFLADELRVLKFEGREEMSRLFEFELNLVSDLTDISTDDLIGQRASLLIQGHEQLRSISGVIEQFEQLAVGRRFAHYRAVLSPFLVPLRFNCDSRIFQQLSTPDIVSAVLEHAGFPRDILVRWLTGSYMPRDYCVQYQESDLDFISRLLEEEGIFYFIDRVDDRDVLIIGDSNGVLEPLNEPVIPFRDESLETVLQEEALHRFQVRSSMRPGRVTTRDFRFKQPQLSLETQLSADTLGKEVYQFPGEYVEPELGQRLVKARLEEQQLPRRMMSGEGSVRSLIPGHRFTLDLHPNPELNREYVILAVTHRGTQPQSLAEEHGIGQVKEIAYRCGLKAAPSDVAYRPARSTPRPRISGLQSGLVVGPSSEEIFCDEYGRVKVQFHWDREGQRNEHSSCWIRVNQPWAGMMQGGLFLPRIGQEVLVQFLEGDPDRPVIVGRVYNGDSPPPYSLPSHQTRSTIKTSSSPGGNGYNELRFEDLAGREEVYLRAQKDWNTEVLNDKHQSIGHNETSIVGLHRFRSVGGNEQVEVAGNQNTTVGGDENTTVEGDSNTVVSGDDSTNVEGNVTQIIGGSQTVIVQGPHTTVHNDCFDFSGAKNVNIKAGDSVSITAGTMITISVGGSSITMTDGHIQMKASGVITIGGQILSLSGEAMTSIDGGVVSVTGAPIKLN